MGKGDQRSRRGKIHRGTFGSRRPRKGKRNPKVAAPAQEPSKRTKKDTEGGV